jgi:hypothetical protein
VTVRQEADAYIDAHRSGWKNAKHAEQWRSTLATYVYSTIGDVSVADVDTGMLVRILEPIWSKKTETANRIRGRIERILSRAASRGHRSGENPARWRGHLENILPARGRVAPSKAQGLRDRNRLLRAKCYLQEDWVGTWVAQRTSLERY